MNFTVKLKHLIEIRGSYTSFSSASSEHWQSYKQHVDICYISVQFPPYSIIEDYYSVCRKVFARLMELTIEFNITDFTCSFIILFLRNSISLIMNLGTQNPLHKQIEKASHYFSKEFPHIFHNRPRLQIHE